MELHLLHHIDQSCVRISTDNHVRYDRVFISCTRVFILLIVKYIVYIVNVTFYLSHFFQTWRKQQYPTSNTLLNTENKLIMLRPRVGGQVCGFFTCMSVWTYHPQTLGYEEVNILSSVNKHLNVYICLLVCLTK